MIKVQDSLVTEEQIKNQLVLKSLNPKTSSNELLSSYYSNQFSNIDKSDRNLLEILELENSESSTMHNKLMIRDLRKKGYKREVEDILAREEETIRSKLKIKKPVLKPDVHIEQCTDPLFFVDDKGEVDLAQCYEVEKGAKFQIFNDQKIIEGIDKGENYDNKDSACKKITKSYKQEAIKEKKEVAKEKIVFDEIDKKTSCPVWMKISEKDEVKKDMILKSNKRFDNAKECIRYEKPYRKYKASPWEFEKNGKGQDGRRTSLDNDYMKNSPGFEEGKRSRESFDYGQKKGLWKVEESDRPRHNYDKKYYGEKTENDMKRASGRGGWINKDEAGGENTFDNEKRYGQRTEKLENYKRPINENYGTSRKDWRNTTKPWAGKQDFEKQNAWDEQSKHQYRQWSDRNSECEEEQKKSSKGNFSTKNNKTQKIDSPELDAWGYEKLIPSAENCSRSNSTTSNCQGKWANPQSNNNTRNYNEKQYYRDRNSTSFKSTSFSIGPKPDTEKENSMKCNEWTPRPRDDKFRPHQPKPDNLSSTEAIDKKPLGIQFKRKDYSPSPFSSNNSNNTPWREHNNQKPLWDNSRFRKDQSSIKYENSWNQTRNDSGQQLCNGDKEIPKEQHIWEPCYTKIYSDYKQTEESEFSVEKLEEPHEFNDDKNASEQPKSILLNKNTTPIIDSFSNSSPNLSGSTITNTSTSDMPNLMQDHNNTLSNPPEKNISAYSSSYAGLLSDILIKPEVPKNEKKICSMMCQAQYSFECTPVVIRKNPNKNSLKCEAQYSLGCCSVDEKYNRSKDKKNPYEPPAINKDKEFGKNEEQFIEIIKRVSDENSKVFYCDDIKIRQKLSILNGKSIDDERKKLNSSPINEQKMSFFSSNIMNKENRVHDILTNKSPNMLPRHSQSIFKDKFEQKSLKILNELNTKPEKISIILDEVPFKEKSQSHHKDSDYNKQQKFVDFTNTLNLKLQEYNPLKSINSQTYLTQKPLENKLSKFENCKKIARQKKINQYFPKDPTGSKAFFPSDLQKKANFSKIRLKSPIKNTLSRSPLRSPKLANDINPITAFFEPLGLNKTFGSYDKNAAPCFVSNCALEKKSSCNQSPLRVDNDLNPLREAFIEKLPCKRQGQEINFYSAPIKRVKKTDFHDRAYKKLDENKHLGYQDKKLTCEKTYCQKEGAVENWSSHQQAWKQNESKISSPSSPYFGYGPHGKQDMI